MTGEKRSIEPDFQPLSRLKRAVESFCEERTKAIARKDGTWTQRYEIKESLPFYIPP